MSLIHRRLSLWHRSSSVVGAFVALLFLILVLGGGMDAEQARAAGQGHGQGQGSGEGNGEGNGASQGGKLGGGLAGGLGGAGGAIGGSVGGALGGSLGGSESGSLGGAAKSTASAGSNTGGGLSGSLSNSGASAAAGKGTAGQPGGTGDPGYAEGAGSAGISMGEGNILGPAVLACSNASGPCGDGAFLDLASAVPTGSISISREALYNLRLPDHNADGAIAWPSKPGADAYDIEGWKQVTSMGNPILMNSEGQSLSSDILARYSTAELESPAQGQNGLEGRLSMLVEATGAIVWKAKIETTVAGSVGSADPTRADSAATSSEADVRGNAALVGGYKLWLGNFKSERDAKRYWARQVRRFPDLFKPLKPVLRRIHSATMGYRGYRLLGGSLAMRDKAEQVCGTIQSHSPRAVCRVVLD